VSEGTSPNVKIPRMWAQPRRKTAQSKEHHHHSFGQIMERPTTPPKGRPDIPERPNVRTCCNVHLAPLLRIALSGWQTAAEIFDLRLDVNAQGSPRNLQGTTFVCCGLGFTVHTRACFSRVRQWSCARYYYRGFAISDVCVCRCWLTLSFGWRTGIIRAALRTIVLEKPDTKGISVLNVFCRVQYIVSYVLKFLVLRVITNVMAPTLQCSLCPQPKLQSL
jgi:hypothetical protein